MLLSVLYLFSSIGILLYMIKLSYTWHIPCITLA